MMETIIVIIVFVVILVIGMMFFFKFSLGSGQEKIEDVCVMSNYILLSYVATMPEVQCSVNNDQESACIDTAKLMVFDSEKEYGSYFSTICKQKVYFTQLLPESDKEVICDTNTYPNCNKYVFYEPKDEYISSIPISVPVSLYLPITDEYQLGRLTVEILQ